MRCMWHCFGTPELVTGRPRMRQPKQQQKQYECLTITECININKFKLTLTGQRPPHILCSLSLSLTWHMTLLFTLLFIWCTRCSHNTLFRPQFLFLCADEGESITFVEHLRVFLFDSLTLTGSLSRSLSHTQADGLTWQQAITHRQTNGQKRKGLRNNNNPKSHSIPSN